MKILRPEDCTVPGMLNAKVPVVPAANDSASGFITFLVIMGIIAVIILLGCACCCVWLHFYDGKKRVVPQCFENRFLWKPKARPSRYEIPSQATNSTPVAGSDRPVRPPRHIRPRTQTVSPIHPIEHQVALSPNNPFLSMLNATTAPPACRLEVVMADVNEEFSNSRDSNNQPNQSNDNDLNMNNDNDGDSSSSYGSPTGSIDISLTYEDDVANDPDFKSRATVVVSPHAMKTRSQQ